jgi:hypothetical protein
MIAAMVGMFESALCCPTFAEKYSSIQESSTVPILILSSIVVID